MLYCAAQYVHVVGQTVNTDLGQNPGLEPMSYGNTSFQHQFQI